MLLLMCYYWTNLPTNDWH